MASCPVVCSNDWDWIVPQRLAVGNMDSVYDGPQLVAHGIKALVSVRESLTRSPEYYRRWGIQVLHIPVPDATTTNLGRYFPLVFAFVDRFVSRGQAVIINCYAGISRSTTLATSYVMRKYRLTAREAMALVQRARPCFNPNPGFVRQLQQYERVLRAHGLMSEGTTAVPPDPL